MEKRHVGSFIDSLYRGTAKGWLTCPAGCGLKSHSPSEVLVHLCSSTGKAHKKVAEAVSVIVTRKGGRIINGRFEAQSLQRRIVSPGHIADAQLMSQVVSERTPAAQGPSQVPARFPAAQGPSQVVPARIPATRWPSQVVPTRAAAAQGPSQVVPARTPPAQGPSPVVPARAAAAPSQVVPTRAAAAQGPSQVVPARTPAAQGPSPVVPARAAAAQGPSQVVHAHTPVPLSLSSPSRVNSVPSRPILRSSTRPTGLNEDNNDAELQAALRISLQEHLQKQNRSVMPSESLGSSSSSGMRPSQAAASSTAASAEVGLCVVCFDADATHVVIPCGHQCVCAACSGQLATCPVCRGSATQFIKVFASGVQKEIMPKKAIVQVDGTDDEENSKKTCKKANKLKKDKKSKKEKTEKQRKQTNDHEQTDRSVKQASKRLHGVVAGEGGGGAEVPERVANALNRDLPNGCPTCKNSLGQIQWSDVKTTFFTKCTGAKKHVFDYYEEKWMAERLRQQRLRASRLSCSDDEPILKLVRR
eukprot:TRINITY_DN7938_c0_g1_i1.p1 TRINITY_DN7938_c0_g1~~TRINITY_DN7938_c0_g1_i1.p1  ORF type:complete len:530 (+),score=89.34 TRINITY_DN7938_c0_g1_i1:143-1732(+)